MFVSCATCAPASYVASRLGAEATRKRLGSLFKLARNPSRSHESPPGSAGTQQLPPPPEHSHTRNKIFRDGMMCLLRRRMSWLAAIAAEPTITFAAQAMQVALRRHLRMLPICRGRFGPTHGCRAQVNRLVDQALARPLTGLLILLARLHCSRVA